MTVCDVIHSDLIQSSYGDSLGGHQIVKFLTQLIHITYNMYMYMYIVHVLDQYGRTTPFAKKLIKHGRGM